MVSVHLYPIAAHSIQHQVHALSQVEVVGFSMTLTKEDMETLDGLNWLNDQVSGIMTSVMLSHTKTST